MTKKHFQFVADVIAAMPSHAPSLRAQKASCANAFANAFAGENPRFDKERFLAACDLNKGVAE